MEKPTEIKVLYLNPACLAIVSVIEELEDSSILITDVYKEDL